jgi:hypothetical protein
MTTKLNAMLNNVDDLKRQMAQRQAVNSSQTTPGSGGNLYV